MNAKTFLLGAIFATCASVASAQGFAGLGSEVDGYAQPDPDTRFQYPADHGAHPLFRIEWWYLTGNLTGADGETYGIQWTLFRNALHPRGTPEDQVWMAHAAISSPSGHYHAERFARGDLGQAVVTASPFAARIDEWALTGPSLSDVTLTAQGNDWAYELTFKATGPFVSQGENGYSVKSESGGASHYYSNPFYSVKGTLTLPQGDVAVSGSGWLDREWSSQQMAGDQSGWDWFSLHLSDGYKMMGAQLRSTSGEHFTKGTWIDPNGVPAPFAPGTVEMTPLRQARVADRDIPVTWRVTAPDRGVDVILDAVYEQSWMPTSISYWEGPVTVSGSHQGSGYLEMTGYE